MEQEIKKNLKTEIIGKNVIFFDYINSTQVEAKELAEKGIQNGSIIVTDNQTDGMGTHGRKWYSSKGDNIAFTLIIYPECTMNNLENLTTDIAQCMIDAIYEVCSKKLDIKEPNDIVFKEKKIGGILTQIITVR